MKRKLARYINNKKFLFSVLSARAPRTCFTCSSPEHCEYPRFACSFIDHHEHTCSFADHPEHRRVILFGNPMFDLYR